MTGSQVLARILERIINPPWIYVPGKRIWETSKSIRWGPGRSGQEWNARPGTNSSLLIIDDKV